MKKGFTLIELMTLIIVLSVIAVISIPIISGLIKDSKQELYNSQVKMIEDAVKQMAIKDTSLQPDTGYVCVPLDNVLKSGLLSGKNVINPKNDEKMNGSVLITFDEEYNQYRYTYQEKSCD